MNNALRPLLLALALLILGGMAAFSQLWVHHKSRPAAAAEHAEWLDRLEGLSRRWPTPIATWSDAEWADAGRIVGGQLRRLAPGDPLRPGEIVFVIEGEAVTKGAFAPKGGLALEARHSLEQQAFLWLLGAAFVALVVMGLVPAGRPTSDGQKQRDLRREIGSVEHLARANLTQAEALERERHARQHTEETLHLQQVLLNRSLEEKMRLGRDLHDGLIQTLYATGLALEGAKNQVAKDPSKATALIDRCIGTINAAIKEVRHEIESLAPAEVRRENFKAGVEAVLQLLDVDRLQRLDLRIPGEISKRIDAEVQAELLQIVREAVSNALRHGQATEVAVRLEAEGNNLCLAIRDNGCGFDLEKLSRRGHGLTNLQARADTINGRLRIESTPGAGTRVILVFSQSDSAI